MIRSRIDVAHELTEVFEMAWIEFRGDLLSKHQAIEERGALSFRFVREHREGYTSFVVLFRIVLQSQASDH